MNRWKLIVTGLVVVLVAAKLSYDFGLRNGTSKIGLAEYHFNVVDAESGDAITNYSFGFPTTQHLSNGNRSGFPRYSTLRRCEDFSIFYAVTDEPFLITIGAEGYSDHAVTLNRGSEYSSGSGPLPMDMATITLRPKAQQDGAGQPATRSESNSESSDKPQPESEGRSR